MVDQKYYSIQEAAAALGCDDETLLCWIHSKELPAVNIAKSPNARRPTWRISEAELGRFLLKRGNGGGQVAPAQSRVIKRPTVKQYV